MMSSLDFRCKLRIVNRGRLVRGKDACTNAIAMHVGVRIVAYMFEKYAMNVCVCTVNAALAAVRIVISRCFMTFTIDLLDVIEGNHDIAPPIIHQKPSYM